jgi:heavy metal translocating P-type ATPase
MVEQNLHGGKLNTGHSGTENSPAAHPFLNLEPSDLPSNGPGAVRAALRRYPLVATTIAIGLIGGVLALVQLSTSTLIVLAGAPAMEWLFSGFALVIVVIETSHMIAQLRRGVFGIDILAIIAIVSTVIVSEYIAALIIVLMVTGGKALEDFAEGRAKRELNALLQRAPQIAHVIIADSTLIRDVAATTVRVGDTFLVRSGEMVPVDGILSSASASFDESSLTGESMPVERLAGDLVLSGSINGRATATITASATAADSQFQGIIALVQAASGNRAPVVRLADRYAVPFTALSLVIGSAAWVISGNPERFAEVLVLATPCPLILAAPVAFMGGMSRAARNGIIVKGGGVLEALARIRTVVFDKTGTLTRGSPTITRILPRQPYTESELLAAAASAERLSSHVLASSVVRAAEERGLDIVAATRAEEVEARGVVAQLGNHEVSIGTLAFIRDRVVDAEPTSVSGGELAMYVAIDGRFAGSIVATDPVRHNARSTVETLARLGVRNSVMLTGDSNTTAEHVARAVGISTVQANCLPADKVNAVYAITARPVLMIGDGVNDAPVLAAADVGIAMGARGATAASESAGAVILVDDLSRAALAVAIGQDTVKIALQSIWLGIMLSAGLMIIATFGLIPAALGAGIQEVVDLATILNALRAVRSRPRS